MRNTLIVVLGLLAVALIGWTVSYHIGVACSGSSLSSGDRGLEWLRCEFKLTDQQYSRIRELNQQYEPICSKLCERVLDSQTKLKNLISQSQAITPEIQEALTQDSALKRECQLAMLQHIYDVTQVLPEGQRKRYLNLVQMHVLMPGCTMGSCSDH